MSFEATVQRVVQLRAIVGEPQLPTSGSVPGAFDAALGTALDARGASTGTALAMSSSGIPILTIADQYRMLGMTPSIAGLPGMPPVGGPVGARMVALAQAELGVTESPSGSNESPRIRQYRSATAGAEGTPGPWCAYFVSWLARESGAPIGAGGNGTGYVPTLEAWGKQEGRWADADATRPQPGDIVIFDWGGDGTPDHTGIVESVDADGTVRTIEGNSSNRVQRRSYGPGSSSITGYVRAG